MSNWKVKLTPEIEQQILASIRAGGFPEVAALAWGVQKEQWEEWLRWGQVKKGGGNKARYVQFFRKVEQAKAQARLRAEMAAMENDPESWLKHGPGRDRPELPGWAAMVRAQI